jgi:hypothetical protein
VIGKLLEQSASKQKEQLLGLPNNNRCITIKKKLQQFTLSPVTYYVLLELLLETPSTGGTIKHPLYQLPDSQQQFSLKNTAMIPIVFELACLTASVELQEQILRGIV